MPPPPHRLLPHSREADILGRKAFEFLSKNHLDLSPDNFELVHAVMTGRDKALRDAFLALPKPVGQAALSILAQRFLPRRPMVSTLKTTSEQAVGALEDLRRLLEGGAVTVAGSSDDGEDPMAALDAQLQTCLDALQAVCKLVTAEPIEVAGQDHLTAQLSFGLPGYPALVQRLDEVFKQGMPEEGLSLMLCRVGGLEPLSRSGLAKVSDYMKNTLARFTHRLIDKSDAAYWTAPDELGLLIGASSEAYLSQLGAKVARVVADAESVARKSIKSMPKLTCRFGCARTYRPVPVSQLYGAARQSLQRADLTESLVPVFTEVSSDASTLRRYEALYGRRQRG
ncbi:MAG: hypothetical protein ACK4HG_13400 [Agrobacterium albertimagni]